MTLARREVLGAGRRACRRPFPIPGDVWADEVVEIRMQGRDDGSHVWFDPIGVLIKPGQMVRWTNLNPGNSHTTTAYHPTNAKAAPHAQSGKILGFRLSPAGRELFDYFHRAGVYDYYCIPHEHAGMVGRIIVGEPEAHGGWTEPVAASRGLPDEALKAFPMVEEIMAKRIVGRL